jgi:hypothetical protein
MSTWWHWPLKTWVAYSSLVSLDRRQSGLKRLLAYSWVWWTMIVSLPRAANWGFLKIAVPVAYRTWWPRTYIGFHLVGRLGSTVLIPRARYQLFIFFSFFFTRPMNAKMVNSSCPPISWQLWTPFFAQFTFGWSWKQQIALLYSDTSPKLHRALIIEILMGNYFTAS